VLFQLDLPICGACVLTAQKADFGKGACQDMLKGAQMGSSLNESDQGVQSGRGMLSLQ
jgi:hypothetical protein